MSMKKTELKSGYTAQMSLPYLNTTNSCMQFFYWLKLDDPDSGDLPNLAVYAVTEEKEKKLLISTKRYIKDWSRLFTELPDGLHQIIIEGTRANNQSSGMAIDDLTIEKCKNIEILGNCKQTREGSGYLGTINNTAKNETCIPWEQVKSPLFHRLPDLSAKDAKNYCRNIPQENWPNPACFVDSNDGIYVSMCNIPFCQCFNDTYFKCDNGLCLPPSLLCNGAQDCFDGTDEAEICKDRQNVACEFNDDYICGYTSNIVGKLTWTKVPSTELSSYTDVTIYKNVIALSHLMFLDSKLGQNGDVIQLISPLWNFTSWTTVSVTYIIIASDITTSDSSSLSLYKYSALRSPVQLLAKVLPSHSKKFQELKVCVPPGQYHLMFQGVQGQPFEQIIGIPYISLNGPCVDDNKTDSLGSIDLTSLESDGPVTFNCSFTSLCGYKFLSTSKYLTWSLIYSKNALNTGEQNTTCGSTFNGVQGYIYSPGYPNDYPAYSDCRFYIDEPEGTTITLIFYEFDIQTQSDCLADSLRVEDPLDDKNKLTACGNIKPRDFKSKGNKLELIFSSDGFENSGKFKIQYFTYADKATDYAVAFKYSSPTELNRFIHTATLISPSMKIFSPMCLEVTMISVTPFKIKLGYMTESYKYTEVVLLTSTTSLGWSWHKQWMDIDTLNAEFVTRYEFEVGVSSITNPGLIGNVEIKNGNCRNLPELQSSTLECNFANITQCGYFDDSEGPVHWFRVYSPMSNAYYMMSSFPSSQSKQVATLISAEVPSSNHTQCLQVNYFTGFQTFTMIVSSSNPSDAPAVIKDLVTDGEFQVNYPLTPSVGNRTITIMTTSIPSTAFKDDGEEREIRIRRIDVLEGPCPTAVDDSTKIDCAFDNFLACNYKLSSSFGGSWTWAAWPDLIGDKTLRRTGVLYYAQTRRSSLKGVLTTPLISSDKTSVLIFHAYTTNSRYANLSILVGDSFGLPTSQTTLMEVNWGNNQTWKNFSVCVPPGNWHLFFVANVLHESETNNKDSIKPFVAIDNIAWNTVPSDYCTTRIKNVTTTNVCNATDLTDCPSSLISWSNAMKWMMVNNAPSSLSQSKEGCLYVFDQSEGWFAYEDTTRQILNTSECDIYIRGRGKINITIWFDVFEIQNCNDQYIEIWSRNSTGEPEGERICTQTILAPKRYATDHILQIHIRSFNKLPKARFHYKYTSETTEGYMYGFYYDGVTEYVANSSENVKYTVASWLSPEIPIDINKVLSTGRFDLCVSIDLLLDYLSLDVYTYYQQSSTSVKIDRVFSTTSHRYSDQGWTNATFQGKFNLPDGFYNHSIKPSYYHKHQFLFTFSIDSGKELTISKISGGQLLAALDNLKIDQGPCPLKNPSSPKLSCKSNDRSSCQFVDISEGPSKWITSTHLAKNAENNQECQLSDNGYVYIGNVSATIFGRTCQRWDSQVPQKHNQDLADYFPDLSMNSTGNKCRNPTNPFIPRNCWCYTMDPYQRREYCDIPPCVDAYFQAELSSMTMDPAIFITKLDITKDSCLELLYDTTTTLIDIEINARQTLDGENMFRILLKREQATTSLNWMKSTVSIYPTDKYLIFLARKTDYTDNIPYAYLSNITVIPGACGGDNNKPVPRVSRVYYEGPRLNRTNYQSFLLYEIENETMDTLNSKMAHQQNDLIHSCKFDSMECGPDDIIIQMTDMGQCYTFNSNSTKEVTTPGAMSGLRLILNVESYQHVPGYVSGVGVKMYLHDANEVPSMQALGLAAQPGLHNLGILSYTTTQNLQPPFGGCGEVPLNLSDSSETYTEAKCLLERNTLEFDEKCNCKEPYMPGNIEVCNLSSYLHCSENVHYSNIRCPSACDIQSFTVQLSQSELSGLRINEVLGDNSASVQFKYQTALEVGHRVDTKSFGSIILNMVTASENILKLTDYIYFSLIQFETSSIKHTEMAIQTFIKFVIDEVQVGGLDVIFKSDQIYESVYKPPLSYFLSSMTNVYENLAYYRGVQNLAYNVSVKTSEDIQWYKQVTNDTYVKLIDFVRASEVFTAEMDNLARVKVYSVCPTTTHEERSNISNLECTCLYDLLVRKTHATLVEFVNVIDTLLNDSNPFSTLDKQVKVQTITDMLELISLTSVCKSKYEIVSTSVKNWLKSVATFPEMKNYTSEIISQNMLIGFNEIQAWINDMKTDYLFNAITLTDLANNVTRGRLDTHMRKINTIITDISQRVVVPMLESMTTIERSIVNVYQDYLSNLIQLDNSSESSNFEDAAKKLNIWSKPSVNLEMPETINFLLFKNETWQVWPSSESLTSFYGSRSRSRLNVLTTNYFAGLRDQINTFTTELTERHETVKKNVDLLNSLLVNYLQSTEIDENFIKTNFLMMDIYYGEMKFDSITTAPNYEWINFFSDLGSYFGLLMGCSVLTMFEVIDLMVYHSIVKLVELNEERKQKRRHVISVNIPSLTPTTNTPDKHKSFNGILNRAFSPERKSGNSISSGKMTTRITDYDKGEFLPPYLPNGNSWNIQL